MDEPYQLTKRLDVRQDGRVKRLDVMPRATGKGIDPRLFVRMFRAGKLPVVICLLVQEPVRGLFRRKTLDVHTLFDSVARAGGFD